MKWITSPEGRDAIARARAGKSVVEDDEAAIDERRWRAEQEARAETTAMFRRSNEERQRRPRGGDV